LRSARQEKVVDLVNKKGFVTTEELCGLLNASQATVRRDIAALDGQNRLRKTHGGAMALSKAATDDMPMTMRWHMQREEKIRIAETALEHIVDGESIFLDSGTTTYELAVKLCAFKSLTIVTNDINIAYEISKSGANNLIVTGGMRKKSSSALIGIIAEQTINQVHVDKAFLSVDAVDIVSGLMDYNTEEIPLKRMMISNSHSQIVLCDHTKFENKAFMSICQLDAIDMIITGKEIRNDKTEILQEVGVRVIRA
jgi:DeoR/GlpR family transcriptional regulator of sugar metabolism